MIYYFLYKTPNKNHVCMYVRMSNRFFEKQPYEICSHSSEKASNGTFLNPDKPQNQSNEGKEKEKKKERGEGKEEKKKSNGCTLSFYNKKLLDATRSIWRSHYQKFG